MHEPVRLHGVACLLLAGSAAAGLTTAWPRDGAGTHQGHPGTAAAPRAPGFTLPPVRVAWVDYSGQLHIGDLATGTQQVAATVDASAADPMIEVGGRLYWAGINENAAPIREYDIATSKIRYLARGNSVFTSADGRHLPGCRQPVDQIIDLPVGLGHDHDRLPRAGQLRRGADHQRGLARTRRRVHHHAAMSAA